MELSKHYLCTLTLIKDNTFLYKYIHYGNQSTQQQQCLFASQTYYCLILDFINHSIHIDISISMF